jgi:hypothetical protein
MAKDILWPSAWLRTGRPVQNVKPTTQGSDFPDDGTILGQKSPFETNFQTHLACRGAKGGIDEDATTSRLADEYHSCAA